ncbi:unnamed protein product [marine sediment metagenome]|uniref:Uncharacterized protein n=1 Tax=marine sediment metagenome TaxID=412755 RepID=X1RDJ8_9ZZZZ
MPVVTKIYLYCPYCGELLDCQDFQKHIKRKHGDKPQRFIIRQHPTRPVDADNVDKVGG